MHASDKRHLAREAVRNAADDGPSNFCLLAMRLPVAFAAVLLLIGACASTPQQVEERNTSAPAEQESNAGAESRDVVEKDPATVQSTDETKPTAGAEAVPPTSSNRCSAGRSKMECAKFHMRQLYTGYARWVLDEAAKCPPSIEELRKRTTLASSNDPWGQPYWLVCPLPDTDDPIGIVSAGPDGQRNTGDDLKSWESL